MTHWAETSLEKLSKAALLAWRGSMQVTEMLRQSLMVYRLRQASPLGILFCTSQSPQSRRTVLTTASRDRPQLGKSAAVVSPPCL